MGYLTFEKHRGEDIIRISLRYGEHSTVAATSAAIRTPIEYSYALSLHVEYCAGANATAVAGKR